MASKTKYIKLKAWINKLIKQCNKQDKDTIVFAPEKICRDAFDKSTYLVVREVLMEVVSTTDYKVVAIYWIIDSKNVNNHKCYRAYKLAKQ